MPILKWLGRVTGKKLYIWLLLLLQAVLGGSSVLYAVLLRNAIDRAVAKSLDGFWYWVGLAILLTGLQILLRGVYRYLEEYTKATIENRIKKGLVEQLFCGDYARVSATHSGEWMNRITSDTMVVAEGIVQILPGLAGMAVKMLGALVLILYYLPGLGGVLIAGGLLMLLVTYGFRKILKSLHKNIQESDGVLRSFIQENLTGLLVVKAFGKEERIVTIAEEKMELHKKARMRKNYFSNFCNMSFAAAMNGMYLLGLIVSGYGIIKGTLTYGTLLAVLQLIGQVQAPFANITGYLPRYYGMLASAERIMEVETEVCADSTGKGAETENCADSTGNGAETEVCAEGTGNGAETEVCADTAKNAFTGIAIEKLSFAYPNETEKVLEKFSFFIKKGEYVALTGESGCGKSTLLKLLMGMYPVDGLQANRKLFAYVPQGSLLTSGTIRQVVSFYEKEQAVDEQRIYEALRVACAEEFIKELPEGLDTELGERGAGLSEGQLQRIAIARAIYAGNPVLLLDESTSALDAATEAQLLKNLRGLTDKTVLIVTHRPAALEICDRVIEM